MAIPLIIGLGAGAVGLYKGGKAIADNNKASSISDNARAIVEVAEMDMNNAREKCEKVFETLGRQRVDALTNNVQNFITEFSKIKNVEINHNIMKENLNLQDVSCNLINDMQERLSFIASSGLGVGTGTVAGALVAYGAYGGTMALATASTGTAISALSGAAATNAALAWLGGGSLAAGGLGVAGGTVALASLAAGPALAVAGWYMGAKAEENLNNAKSNLSEAKKFREAVRTSIKLTDNIRSLAELAYEVLSYLRRDSRRALQKLKNTIEKEGMDYSVYTSEAKDIVLRNVKIIQLIKVVLDTPILDKEGNIMGDSSTKLKNISNECKNTIGQ